MPEQLKRLVSESSIRSAVTRLAQEIRRDYKDKNPLLLGILKGSFVFMADLVRKLDMPLEVDFVRLSSYDSGTESSGKVRITSKYATRIRNRHVIVIEDIIDTGLTTTFLLGELHVKKPASLKLCALIDKPSRRKVPVNINYPGFELPDKFIVGYGIDCDEKYRYLPDICYIE